MVKYIFIGSLVFILYSFIIPPEKIVGKWMYKEDGDEVQFIFNSDNSFEYFAILENSILDTLQLFGKFELKDSLLIISINETEPETHQVIRIEKDTLELKFKAHQFLLTR